MDFLSPLRYPGGKAKLAPYIQQVIIANNLMDGVYIEPYAGGASIALDLLFGEFVSKIVINDKDRAIFSFWHSVINDTDSLCRLIEDTNVTIDEWNKQKEVQRHKDEEDMLTVGFSTFFLNRTNRSGILKAGVIGGMNQDGNYRMDVRYNKQDLIKRIIRVADYSDRIDIYNEDAVALLKQVLVEKYSKSLIYLDPPYYIKGRGLYLNYYRDEDHIQIAKQVSELGMQKWLITYDNVPFICDIYKQYRSATFELNYSANNSGKGKEIMIYSDNLVIPETNII